MEVDDDCSGQVGSGNKSRTYYFDFVSPDGISSLLQILVKEMVKARRAKRLGHLKLLSKVKRRNSGSDNTTWKNGHDVDFRFFQFRF